MNVFDITSEIRLSARFVFEECFELDFVLAEMSRVDPSSKRLLGIGYNIYRTSVRVWSAVRLVSTCSQLDFI